jgi:hypothetical protein
MKKKIFIALTALFALSFAITVFALNRTNVSSKRTADCCAKKDSCPMKDKQANADKKSCCDKADCCKDGDSCPMKKDAEKQTTASVDMTNVTVASSNDDCCQTGADCCKGGSCCKGKHN